eukprot:gene49037-60028_t
MAWSVVSAFRTFSSSSARRPAPSALRAALGRRSKEAPANPVAVVTGASRGIGKAVALALGAAGCKVIVNFASNEEAAQLVVSEIKAQFADRGGGAVAIKANCANVEEVRAMFQRVNSEVGAVDVLVNNAGITRDMLTMMMQPRDFTDVIDLNLGGVFYCAQSAFTG